MMLTSTCVCTYTTVAMPFLHSLVEGLVMFHR